MTDAPDKGLDYSQTLFLPRTDFPMRAGLPEKEPEILGRWERERLYEQLRESGKGRPKFVITASKPTQLSTATPFHCPCPWCAIS